MSRQRCSKSLFGFESEEREIWRTISYKFAFALHKMICCCKYGIISSNCCVFKLDLKTVLIRYFKKNR